HTIRQNYFFFGLLPKEQIVVIIKYCPEGPRSSQQFTSFCDGAWVSLTLTIFSPLTLAAACIS
ncbi:Bor/Iss family lipoprotein, partial [Leptospira interrogans]|uniref:Bor/Iss family lipoprotein n=1 Tax=Leptospira interrogans TaxID=173 RepID=UPI001A0C1F77|nr:hypothetical protein [Leptospira interrogans serovar Pomona]